MLCENQHSLIDTANFDDIIGTVRDRKIDLTKKIEYVLPEMVSTHNMKGRD